MGLNEVSCSIDRSLPFYLHTEFETPVLHLSVLSPSLRINTLPRDHRLVNRFATPVGDWIGNIADVKQWFVVTGKSQLHYSRHARVTYGRGIRTKYDADQAFTFARCASNQIETCVTGNPVFNPSAPLKLRRKLLCVFICRRLYLKANLAKR